MPSEAVKSLFIAFTNPLPGKEDEYNDWYTNVHLAEVVALPGFISARRYKLTKEQRVAEQPFRYAAVYEVESGKAQAILDNLEAGIPTMTIAPVIDLDNGSGVLVESISDTLLAVPKNR